PAPAGGGQVRPQPDDELRLVIGLAERPRQRAVADLPVALLRVRGPQRHAPVRVLPQPRLEADLELRLAGVDARAVGVLGERMRRRGRPRAGMVAVAADELVRL